MYLSPFEEEGDIALHLSVQYLENVMIFHNGLVMNRRRPLVILRSRSFRIGNGNINILIILSLMDIKYCILVHHN